jgi:hypothetical protein
MDAFTWTFELPERAADAPPPSSETVRRIESPDGEHWFEVKGGATMVEQAYIRHLNDQLTKAVKRRQADEIDEAAFKQAQEDYNAGLATFVADRVVDHNLTDFDGNKLPLGMALFFELPGRDGMRLVGEINTRRSIWTNPKAETSSTTG